MLTQEKNELLTHVGPGTPMGDLLRRYWHPVGPLQDLTDDHPTKYVRILGEDLVLFKDKSGRVGLIQYHCMHRGASLEFGRVEERGISCAYHGWLYDVDGNCLEQPCEPADSKFYQSIKATAYPVQQLLGLHWAYLGPQPAPVIPHYEPFVRKDLRHWLVLGPQVDANWLQVLENGVDPYHSAILHQDSRGKGPLPNTTRGNVDFIDRIECFLTSYGIMKRQYYKNGGWYRQHPMIFPNMLALERVVQISVPIDDTHTARYRIAFAEREENDPEDGEELPVTYQAPHKSPADAQAPFAKYEMLGETEAQDYMVFETQGPIANRTIERLASSDRWVIQLREMYADNIAVVQDGGDPFGVIRDPGHEMIALEMGSESQHRYDRDAMSRVYAGDPLERTIKGSTPTGRALE